MPKVRAYYACGYGICPLSETNQYPLGARWLSIVQRCPLLRGSKFIISIGIAIEGVGFVHCRLLLEVSL